MADQDKATVFRELYYCSSCSASGEIDHQSVGRDKRSTHTQYTTASLNEALLRGDYRKKKESLFKKQYFYKRMIFQTFRKVSIHYS